MQFSSAYIPVTLGSDTSFAGFAGRSIRTLVMGVALMALAACATGGGKSGVGQDIPTVSDPAPYVSGTMRPYTIRGRTYRPAEQPDYDETGIASWYGQYHHGRPTSTGERFDMNALTAAHKTLPLPSMVEVTNPANGRRVLLRVNDRGPFADGRIIDLSRGAADALGLLNQGVGQVRVRYAGRAPRTGGGMVLSDVGERTRVQPARPQRAPEPARNDSTATPSRARPYNEVLNEEARRRSAPQPAPRSTSPRTRRDIPIPQQPIPPVMPPRDALLTPQPAAVAPVATTAPVQGFKVQAIVFEDKVFADGVARRLGDGATVETFTRNGRQIYRVVTGPWPDAEAAERSRQAIIARGFSDALLIAD